MDQVIQSIFCTPSFFMSLLIHSYKVCKISKECFVYFRNPLLTEAINIETADASLLQKWYMNCVSRIDGPKFYGLEVYRDRSFRRKLWSIHCNIK
jgi:hypothetical protein